MSDAHVLRQALAKKKRLKRFGAIKSPKPIERDYARQLLAYVSKLHSVVLDTLVKRLPILAADFYRNRPDADHLKRDADAPGMDDLDAILDEVRINFARSYSDDEIKAIARRKGIEVSQYNQQVLQMGLKRVTGVDLLFGQPWLTQELELFAIANTTLIKNLADDALDRVQSAVFEGFRSGLRSEEIAKQIEDQLDPQDGPVERRAQLIARDQVSKLNGQLTELRQGELGISKYIWRTSLDERVRESHRRNEGKVFSWASPPVETGNPGEDYNCRCVAEPYLEDMLGKDFRSNAPVFPGDDE